jgi:hypothetical protein
MAVSDSPARTAASNRSVRLSTVPLSVSTTARTRAAVTFVTRSGRRFCAVANTASGSVSDDEGGVASFGDALSPEATLFGTLSFLLLVFGLVSATDAVAVVVDGP